MHADRLSPNEEPFHDLSAPRNSRRPVPIEEADRCLAIVQGLDCDFGDAKLYAKILEDADSSDVAPIIFSFFWPGCKFNETPYVLREDIDSVVKDAPAVRRPKASAVSGTAADPTASPSLSEPVQRNWEHGPLRFVSLDVG